MRLRHAVLLAVLVPSLLSLATLPSDVARAQDDDAADNEGAEKPEGPPVEPAIRFVDTRSTVEIELPKNWKSEKFTDNVGELAHWVWPTEGGAIAGVTLFRRTDFMRAPLMRYMMFTKRALIEGSKREGDGWVEAGGIEEDRVAVWERYVEHDGIVWVAQYVCHKSNVEVMKPVIVAALESFKVIGEYEAPGLPDGWTEKKLKNSVLWTDADEKKVDEAVALVERLDDMRSLADKVLGGDAYYDEPTRVMVIQNGSLFDKTAVENTGQKPDNSAYDGRNRALLVKWMSRNSQGFDQEFEQFAASQLVSEHFGGNLPFWLSGGLRMYVLYGFQDGGKPQKPDKDRMARTRGTIALAKRRLNQWFTTNISDVPDTNAGFAEVWAWHWFCRHAKQGKKYRKTYEDCLATLLETGDPEKAHAVWDGTDFEKMHADFKKWGESIK